MTGLTLTGVTKGNGFGSWSHLSLRFFGALLPKGPAPADESWALGHLLSGEQELWKRMSGPDRRHAVRVARDSIRLLEASREKRDIVAAALLHDVGKVESSFGTFARVGITLMAMVFGRARILRWTARYGDRPASRPARVGMYLTHDRLGAQLLERAGSGDLTVSWAAEHHLAPEFWTVDSGVAVALKAADGD